MASRKKTTTGKAKKKTTINMEQLKQFIRTRGADFLQDRNITSVGIGYKQKDGKRTNELSIQFTVAQKAAPEVLESLGTTTIPESFTIGGVVVPTDVIQRAFTADYRVVAESLSGPRKTRLDPIVPGISVAHKKETAGTIGCIVFDRNTGVPHILSNWHVLHGPSGNLGDEVVQPGPFDDNRTHLNRLGKLVRSHLGPAGDCAIASIEGRGFDPSVLDLGVKVEQLGEPELGDKVIKSGRTTAVTHGIVTRVDTMTKIDYGGAVGEQLIGGFEIGPDENHLSANGEISMGGDSGSLWLFKTNANKPTKIMAGLHFAGEGPGDPNEHAVACYPRSVFEKLNIALTPPPSTEGTASGLGYAANFLGLRVDLPKLSTANQKDAFKLQNSAVIAYTHFSLALSKTRRFAYWVAWNIDGSSLKSLSRKGIKFVLDPKIPAQFQVGDELYRDNRLDRGHLARRADLLWGNLAEARQANKDSFFFTNITPQMDNFNQSSQGGIWGQLEDALFENVEVDGLRVSVFGGPVFHSDDRIFRKVKIPREFFKVLAFMEGGELKAKAFLLTQSLDQLELIDLQEFKVFQVALTEIEDRCGFTFPDNLKAADSFAEELPEALAKRKPLSSVAEIVW